MDKIGRVNADGSITEFPIPLKAAGLRGIAALSSNTPCFTEFTTNQIGCIEKGQLVERALGPGAGPEAISRSTNQVDLWFTENSGNRIGVLHFSGVSSLAQARLEKFSVPTAAAGLSGIVSEFYEGSAWFTEKSAGQIGFISRDGRVTEYPLPDRSGQPAGVTLSFLGARFVDTARNRVSEIQPEAVLVAAGVSGGWGTEMQVGNPISRPLTILAGRFPRAPGVCAGPCPPGGGVALPANGSGQIDVNTSSSTLLTFFVRGLEEGALPSVRARIYDRNLPSRSADLPTIRLSTLTAVNPRTLVFPGALKDGLARSNLLLVDASVDRLVIGPIQTTRVRVELLDSGGSAVASGDFDFGGGGSLYLVDVIGRLGVPVFPSGQLRVSKLGEEGLLWGWLATVNSDGAVSVFSGLNP